MIAVGLTARCGSTCRQILKSEGFSKFQKGFPLTSPRQKHHEHHHALFSSQTVYQDPTLTWAQANPRLAQECLNPPPLTNTMHSSAEKSMDSFEAYLEWRRWTFPKEITEESQDGDPGSPTESAKSLASHLLSAPLTLASQFRQIIQNSTNKNINDGSTEFNWCCIGARAEATIPVVYWKEFLLSSNASLSSSDFRLTGGNRIPSNKIIQMSLDFVGPDIHPKLSEQSVSIPEGQEESHSPLTSLNLRGYHRGFFHDIPAEKMEKVSWDAYMFFSPGFGHPNLQKSWEPTLKLILEGRLKRSPSVLLLTAHSEHDMTRDAAILENVYGLRDIVYQENPFASRIKYEDPFEKNHFVRPNHYVATLVI